MKKFLSILLTLVLFLSLVGCKFPGFNSDNNNDDENDEIELRENEKAFKEFLEANKMPTVAELDEEFAELYSNIDMPEDIFVGNSLLANTKASITVPNGDSSDTADFYLYQKENKIYAAGIPRTFEDEAVSGYLDLEYLEELYDQAKASIPTDLKLSEIVDTMLEQYDADFDFEELLSIFEINENDFTTVENGKFQIKNTTIFAKLIKLSGNKDITVEDLLKQLVENKITLSFYVYFDSNLLKGYEVVVTEENENGEVMTVNCKLSFSYTNNELCGLELKFFATDVIDATVAISYLNDEFIFNLDLVSNESVDLDANLKVSNEGLEFSASLEDLTNNEIISVTASITKNNINISVKEDNDDLFKCNIDATMNDNTLSIDGAITWTSYSGHQGPYDDYPTYETSVNTITFNLESGENVIIPAEVYALESEAEDLIEVFTSSNQPQVAWVRELYFYSYTDGEILLEVGTDFNGTMITSDYANIYIDGDGNGKLFMDGMADSQEFYFDVYAFEDGQVAPMKLASSTDEDEFVSATIQQIEERVVINVEVYHGDELYGYQVFTFVPYRLDVDYEK